MPLYYCSKCKDLTKHYLNSGGGWFCINCNTTHHQVVPSDIDGAGVVNVNAHPAIGRESEVTASPSVDRLDMEQDITRQSRNYETKRYYT